MSSCAEQPQHLIYAVVERSSPVLEVWFVGGRGSRRQPLLIELLGGLGENAAAEVLAALEALMDRHGPWLALDLSGMGSSDGSEVHLLDALVHCAERRGGGLVYDPPLVG
jgi:hypothetical protein